MNRRSTKRLHDALDHSTQLVEMVQERTAKDLDNDFQLKLSIHKLMEIIGEALIQAVRSEPELSASITDFRRYADMRNRLVHAYDSIDYDTVLKVAQTNVPLLIAELESLLATRPPAAGTESDNWFDE